MHKKSLDWLANAASVDIFIYSNHKLQDISTGDKHFNRGVMLKASKQAKSGLYTIVQYKSGYMLLVPINENAGLILLPKMDINEDLRNVFSSIDFVSHSINTAKLAFHLYTGLDAPDWDITMVQLHGDYKVVEQTRPMNEMVTFHVYTVKMIEALTNLDEDQFKESLTDMKGCRVFGEALTTTNVIRGQKDILIDLISKLTDNVTKLGLPIEKVIPIQMGSIQKIEYQTNILNFDAWLEEIPWIFFNAFRNYRQSLFKDKAERIKDYLKNHAQDNLRLKDISEVLGISEQNLNQIFKKKFGATIKQFSIQLKVEAAKGLLTTTRLKIKDIADYLSFADESYFVQTFSKLIGATPAKFRQAHIQAKLTEIKNAQL
ncbi:MAG: AraC family transcriptional regulator [Oenococcus sp.]|uniref:helix-turn-helix domain-containing protein n=1 Tax=Oenococcus sp. TaxID=1979414 RepID=UPI0039EC5F7D